MKIPIKNKDEGGEVKVQQRGLILAPDHQIIVVRRKLPPKFSGASVPILGAGR